LLLLLVVVVVVGVATIICAIFIATIVVRRWKRNIDHRQPFHIPISPIIVPIIILAKIVTWINGKKVLLDGTVGITPDDEISLGVEFVFSVALLAAEAVSSPIINHKSIIPQHPLTTLIIPIIILTRQNVQRHHHRFVGLQLLRISTKRHAPQHLGGTCIFEFPRYLFRMGIEG